ncbi:MAG TPA: hypothetical protein VGG49_04195 [Steroidobacteraceae bacterium]|jgi:hypothetical protein
MTDAVHAESSAVPRAAVIARRLQVLEMEAAVQRTTLAATLGQWQQHRTLTWVLQAAKMAGGALASPTARWLLTAVVMRLIRGRRA